MHLRRSLAIVGLVLMVSSIAFAGTATANLSVSATIAANCTVSTGPVAFGSYDPIVTNAAANLNGTGSVITTCTNASPVTLTLGQGSNANTGSTDAVPLRRMISGTNFLNYSLYSNAARTTVWGNTAGTGVASTGTGSAVTVSVYGAVTSAQNQPAGTYSDTVVATVTF